MNKALFYFVIFIICTGFYSIENINKLSQTSSAENVVVAFIAYNDNGNNLYIDNVTAGKRPAVDVAITSINNIPSDTSFAPNTSSFKIVPRISLVNLGVNNIPDSIKVYITIPSLSYADSSGLAGLTTGAAVELSDFDSITVTPGTGMDINVSTTYADSNVHNNYLYQYSIYLPERPEECCCRSSQAQQARHLPSRILTLTILLMRVSIP